MSGLAGTGALRGLVSSALSPFAALSAIRSLHAVLSRARRLDQLRPRSPRYPPVYQVNLIAAPAAETLERPRERPRRDEPVPEPEEPETAPEPEPEEPPILEETELVPEEATEPPPRVEPEAPEPGPETEPVAEEPAPENPVPTPAETMRP